MNLLRFAGRAAFASYFAVRAAELIRHPEKATADAEPVQAKVQALAERFLPESAARFVPKDPVFFVRLHGAVDIVAALLVATGFGRRLGALVLAKSQALRVAARPALGADVALLGAAVIEALDTQGKPSLAYRLTKGAPVRAKLAQQAIQLKAQAVQQSVAEALD